MLLGPGGWGVFFFSFFVRQIAFLGFFESKLVLGTWVLELHYLTWYIKQFDNRHWEVGGIKGKTPR